MKYLITSALPYINGIKHLGNLIGSMLPADVYARYLRQLGHEVLYICGTDEHGTPAELAAQSEHLDVADYCQKMYQTQKEIYAGFDIQFDYFGRSSDPSNHAITQAIFNELDKNGFIEEKIIDQVYSIDDQRFLPDRYVVGTCPTCQFDKARGDQCDLCGRLLDPTDLIKPRSAISGSENLEVRQVNHLFLSLQAFPEKLAAWLATKEATWSTLSMSVANKWLKEGLHSRCISRDLKWGVPIQKEGYQDKVFYVWFDAPMAYIAMTQDWARLTGKSSDEWKKWWLEKQEETFYIQFMGKDNLPFHTIMWPAMLLGTDSAWKTVDDLKSFHWLTYEGGKFSTSQNRGIFSDVALQLFPADYWRYYLLANIPENQDADFKLADFIGTINKDLVGTLGNFVNRVATLVKKYFVETVPVYTPNNPFMQRLAAPCAELAKSIENSYAELNFRAVMRHMRELWSLGNEFITEAAPWTTIKTDTAVTGEILAACLHLIRIYAYLAYPIMPETAKKIFHYIDNDDTKLNCLDWSSLINFSALEPGSALNSVPLIFEKITEEKASTVLAQFAGD